MFRKIGNSNRSFNRRYALTVNVEYDLMEKVRDIASERRMTISEIVNDSFLKFIEQNQGH